ncbi:MULTISPECIES: NAD(P)/FAD-dependent oxidoreductase [unclassified Pseudonocardia]|uniref:dihydrolipoyl dehydrogenase family protein n=1 Tax=unclassified Pseudonocardia TaxID=2619320 RepID=UPI0001FFE2E4|nr:NAD(P)/FAD-dependent oxidoreductase [Pseudonocardia sp. Ae707_Ps1]OLM15770.1 PF00070 family, FAD-dependent NAD(P)-disulfide oxidoreductase [Pseudonocardia sp. Ae707_Ps1]
MSHEYDVVVIGAGPVGENAAGYAVDAGLSAAIVEAELLGGECSYWACIPSKALLRTPQAVADARRLPGVTADFDPAAVLERRTSFTSNWDDTGQVEWAEGAGAAVLRGRGRLAGERTVVVTGADGTETTVTARRAVVLATGSVPVTPPVPGLDTVEYWGSRGATSAKEIPPRFGVLGGGVVGCEMALAFARLGSRVTLVNHGPRVLPNAEPVASERVADGLREAGVDVRLDTGLDRVEAAGDATRLHLGGEVVEVDRLLVATGRRPASDGLGLDTVGVTTTGRGAVPVDDSGLVDGGGDWLYAVGDVNGRAPLTHQGKYQARIAAHAIAARAAGRGLDDGAWGEDAATADHHAVPQVVFTDPEVAWVGRTADAARRDGLDVRVVDMDIAVAGSSLTADDWAGRVVAVVDTRREVLIGVTFVGPGVAELLHGATIAVVGEVPLARLWHAVPAFPTVSEVWLRLLETYRAG